jgi:hypothetical protein
MNLERHALLYQAFYCEENVWQLARTRTEGAALFITNRLRRVAFRHQRRAPAADAVMMWDYHVVWLEPSTLGDVVYDFDTTLPWPTPLKHYLEASFPYRIGPLAPLFRIVPRASLLAHFASDRRHMRAQDGSFFEEPPPWPCPGDGATSNLDAYLDVMLPVEAAARGERLEGLSDWLAALDPS